MSQPRSGSDASAEARARREASRGELESLMEAYQRADGAATSRLIERLSPMLLRFLAGPLQTRGHAEDTLQDCWMRIHRARHTYRPGSPLLPWIFAIARHTRVDAYRRRSQIARRELAAEDLEAAGAVAAPAEANDGDIWKLVRQLPDSQQEVVTMLKVAGLSLEETARATRSTVGSVKQKAHRAYRRLRELLLAQGFGR